MEEIPNKVRKRMAKATDQVSQPSGARFKSGGKKSPKRIPESSSVTDEKDVDFRIRLLSARSNACYKFIVLIALSVLLILWTGFALNDWTHSGNLLLIALDAGPAALFAKIAQHIFSNTTLS